MDIEIEEIDVQRKSSVVKSLHASWLIKLYNYMTWSARREVCMKGWQNNGIYNTKIKGINDL